ncbi:MAG: tetratricopeptide repeat protein [Holophagales bacterium]|nr:tetratricopeptide repeat protein [Holophagales bacterium]
MSAMRIRSFLGLLFATAVAIYAAVLHHYNRDLFHQPIHLSGATTVPLWGALLAIFLAGFLPTGITLVIDTLRRDLARRRSRRRRREAESLDATLRRAVDLAADGQPARAVAELESYLAARPEDFQGLLHYGEVLRQLGRVDEAIEVHRRAVAHHPQSAALLYGLAEDYVAAGDAEGAREIEGRLLRELSGMGLGVLKSRRAEAIAKRDWPTATELHERASRLVAEGGAAAALARESDLAQGLDYQRGVLRLEQDRVEEATDLFRKLLAREPRFIPARIMLGEAELVAGREEAALVTWRSGYRETGSPVFLHRIEDYLIEVEQPARAIETLRQLIAEAENDLLPRFYLGRLYYRLEMHDEALKQLAAVEERIRSSPTFHYLVARIHERRGDLARAIESYSRCVRQLGLGSAEYACRACGARSADWRDACAACGSWNAVELAFEEEKLSAEALGVVEVPVWSNADDSGEYSVNALPREPAN